MARGPMSWKTKLLLGFVVLFIVGIIFGFTEWGVSTMRGWLDSNYQKTPAAERVNMWSASWWLKLSYWEGRICGRKQEANQMYQDFFGIKEHDGAFVDKAQTYIYDFEGKFDGTNKTGWGPLHPKACDGFYDFMDMNFGGGSADSNGDLGYMYYYLFYTWYMAYGGTGKPHPRFYVYWDQVEKGYIAPNHYRRGPVPVMPKPPEFDGPD